MESTTRTTLAFLVAILVVTVIATGVQAQTIDERVQSLEERVDKLATTGLVLFLYGAFCALWAQRTGRGAWCWFFLGLFFGPITAVVLLAKNSRENKS